MSRSRKRVLWALGGVSAVMVVWALLAPPERQLGESIRWVYLHVALTWAGTLGIYLAGFGGLRMAVFPVKDPDVRPWSLGFAGVVLFAAGFLLSLVSASTSWGGILWEEPRTLASVGIIALGGIVLWATRGGVDARWKGAAWALFAIMTAWSLQTVQLFLHPDEPVGTSPSGEIRWTFYGLFLMAVIAAALIVRLVLPGGEPDNDNDNDPDAAPDPDAPE